MATTALTDADDFRRRTRVYLLVLFVIDLGAYVGDLIAIVFDTGGRPELGWPYAALRYLTTVALVVGLIVGSLKPPRRQVLGILELSVTLGLAINYALLSNAFLGAESPETAPAAGLLGATLLLTLRASLVPSGVVRTTLTGIAAMGCWWWIAQEGIAALPPVATEGFTFMAGAFIVATSVTSWVIYGLRRDAQEARRLGQYELGEKLGEGGMGIVYKGTHVMLRRPTAVKLLPLGKAGAEAVARFEREVVHTSRLEHPNSVFIYDYGRTPEGQFYYAMEYLDGLTLRELVKRDGPLPPERVVHILRQTASALSEAHGLGLVHRDIKPANIMLCQRAGEPDVVKVLDFGLVKSVDNSEVAADVTNANAIVGTPQYLAPEAIRAPEQVGAAADVYALGAVGYFLLTGRHVFVANTAVEVCSLHLTGVPESPAAIRGEPLPDALEALVLRCLHKDPADRPSNGRAVVTALDALRVDAWSPDEADRWWSSFGDERTPAPVAGGQRTQLKVDFGKR
ncbi:MAG: serine/threonine-protein kinase [Myxococcota bacterium]